MANSAKIEKEERVWDDPIISDQIIPVAISRETLLVGQTAFLQNNPDCIYRYLKDLNRNNQTLNGYSIGFMCICIGVMITFAPLFEPEITFQDISGSIMLCGIVMIIMATIIGRVQQS